MRNSQRLISALLLLAAFMVLLLHRGCVEDYNPNVSGKDNLMVINGSIIRGNEVQRIDVSRSTSVNNPEIISVEDCYVYVMDDMNNLFVFEEESPGAYKAEIDQSYLDIGASFKLTVETPGGRIYESSYEEILDCHPIDSMYFMPENNISDQPHLNGEGQRLHLDVYAKEGYTDYYRWKIHETWESRSSNAQIDQELVGVLDTFITTYRYDSLNSEWVRSRAIPLPDFKVFTDPDTFHICYLESEVDESFYASTSNVLLNTSKRVPLQFIPNGVKLSFRYSCLVSQFSHSEEAYNYWQTKLSEVTESGELYYAQPGQNLTNIMNVNDEQETVLGYFWVSAMSQKRVFFEGPYVGRPGCASAMVFDVEDFYEANPFGKYGEFRFIDSMYSPVYIINGNTYPPSCFDCRYSGGILEKPKYW